MVCDKVGPFILGRTGFPGLTRHLPVLRSAMTLSGASWTRWSHRSRVSRGSGPVLPDPPCGRRRAPRPRSRGEAPTRPASPPRRSSRTRWWRRARRSWRSWRAMRSPPSCWRISSMSGCSSLERSRRISVSWSRKGICAFFHTRERGISPRMSPPTAWCDSFLTLASSGPPFLDTLPFGPPCSQGPQHCLPRTFPGGLPEGGEQAARRGGDHPLHLHR